MKKSLILALSLFVFLANLPSALAAPTAASELSKEGFSSGKATIKEKGIYGKSTVDNVDGMEDISSKSSPVTPSSATDNNPVNLNKKQVQSNQSKDDLISDAIFYIKIEDYEKSIDLFKKALAIKKDPFTEKWLKTTTINLQIKKAKIEIERLQKLKKELEEQLKAMEEANRK